MRDYLIHEEKYSKNSPIRKSKSPKSKLLQDSSKVGNLIKGRIVETVGNIFYVLNLSTNEVILCSLAGKLATKNQNTSLAVVGDFVGFNAEGSNRGVIHQVEERYSKLSRKAAGRVEIEHVIAANVDLVVITMSAADPFYNKRLIDRYLVSAEAQNLNVILIINKIELMDLDFIKDDLAIYEKIGYEIYYISVFKKINLDLVIKRLENQTSIFSGPSGTGKSSLINIVMEDEAQDTGEISPRTLKGQHTTSSVKMQKNHNNTYIIDSPGIREFGIWDVDKADLHFFFREFGEFSKNCKYNTCEHIHEPECAIIQAVEEGNLSPERYESYINIYDSLNS